MASPTEGSPYDPRALLAAAQAEIVGMTAEAELVAVALATGRHLVLEGPPGTGKSTLLRTITEAARVPLRFVEGNAELTPNRLVGHHDPAMVLQGGYRPESFVFGPLADAVQHGGVLYLEELNRIPEESLNVLITALAEGELHVPRFGRIPAHPSFRLIAAMNPFDAIGTSRIGQAIYDRMCRVAVTYQDEAHERSIVRKVTALTNSAEPAASGAFAEAADTDAVQRATIEIAVAVVRQTRAHKDVRVGSSVRGAIDTALLADGLRRLRGTKAGELGSARQVLVDAVKAGLSGRIRLDESSDRLPEEVLVEILDAVLKARFERSDGTPEDDQGKAPSPDAGSRGDTGQGRILTGEEAKKAVQEAARRTSGRNELRHRHGERFDDASPETGQLDQQIIEDAAANDADTTVSMLADMANATDARLRAEARRLAAKLFLRMAKRGTAVPTGVRRMERDLRALRGDLDLDATMDRSDGLAAHLGTDLVTQRWGSAERSLCLLIDRSGSMSGEGIARAALAAASVVVAAGERGDCSVVVFARDAIVLQRQGQHRRPTDLLGDVLSLRGRGVTNISLGLDAARAELASARHRERTVVLLGDAISTEGPDPLDSLRGIDRLHVLGTSAEPDSIAAASLLAKRGHGRYQVVESVAQIPLALTQLLNND